MRAIRLTHLLTLPLALVAAGACDDDGVDPQTLRFGQSGEVRVQLITGTAADAAPGERRQVISWTSDGRWRLFESIGYRGLVGDEASRSSPGDPASYAALISSVNEGSGTRLFIDELDPDLRPACVESAALTLTIRDDVREEERSWQRCVTGPLERLDAEGAGPDAEAGRVARAARFVRDRTVGAGDGFSSAFHGSLPFGTLDRGSDSEALLNRPVAIVAEGGEDGVSAPREWADFWEAHAGPGSPVPAVDWEREMVLLGFVGVRDEAGDSVEIRRVLPVSDGALVEVGLRVPGDFCAPASMDHVPFHIAVAPRVRPSVNFSDLRLERVPCTP